MKNPSRLEKILISTTIVLVIVAATLLVLLIINQGKPSRKNVCDSSDCVKASASILGDIDPSLDPCGNFYNFACGNFVKKSLITKESNAHQRLNRIVKTQINQMITDDVSNGTSQILRQQRKFYKTCTNLDRIEATFNETFLNRLEDLGGWPLIKNRFWNENHFHWLNTTLKCRKFGLPFEHLISFSTDQINGYTGLTILRPTLIEHVLNESYIDLITDVSREFGAALNYARIESVKIYYFQKELFSLLRFKSNKTEITLQELTEKTGIPWLKFLKNLTQNLVELNETTVVVVDSLHYFEHLNGFLSRFPKRVQANYFIWRIAESYVNLLGAKIRERYRQFLIGNQNEGDSDETRQEFCLRKSKEFFSGVAEIEFVRRSTTLAMRRDIQTMIDKIKKQLIRLIRHSDWIDSDMKAVAENRLNSFETFIGWSDKVFNEDIARSVSLENLELPTDNLIEMMSVINIRDFDNVLQMINKNFTQLAGEIWRTTPLLDVNAYYSPQLKTLVLPSSILQEPFYDITYPKFMNYGSLGSIIGHELTHALIAETTNFNKSQCLIEHYENFTDNFGKFTDNGTIAFEEILSDFVGTQLAYRAYNDWIEENGSECVLPGLDYSPQQVFWIRLSTIRCYQMKFILDTDKIHGLPAFSVIGSLRNSPDFAGDYQCPIDSYMNPGEKCPVF